MFDNFLKTISNFFTGALDWIAGIFDTIFGWIESLLNFAVMALPSSPFAIDRLIPPQYDDYIAILNWFIPFQAIVTILYTWLIAVGTWYGLKAILAVVKVHGD